MAVTILGERTVGECVPSSLAVNARLLADLQARLQGAIALQARLAITPPSLDASITAAVKMLANMRLSVALPGASLNFLAIVKVIGELTVRVQEALSLNIAFGTGGVMALAYAGQSGAMGGELNSTVQTLFPPSNDAVALVLIATEPATRVAMNLVFGVNL